MGDFHSLGFTSNSKLNMMVHMGLMGDFHGLELRAWPISRRATKILNLKPLEVLDPHRTLNTVLQDPRPGVRAGP